MLELFMQIFLILVFISDLKVASCFHIFYILEPHSAFPNFILFLTSQSYLDISF
jgi:hypothetical protein